jgi:hypothetical protein
MKTILLLVAISILALSSCVDSNKPPIEDKEDLTLQEPDRSMDRGTSTMLTPSGGETNDTCTQECPLQHRCEIARAICGSLGGTFNIVGQCDQCGCPYECRSGQSGEVVGNSWCGPARIIVPC